MAAYLLAVAILFCIQGWASGTVEGKVTPFMEVYERSACQARETVVPILKEYPHEVSHIFRPPCVAVPRCGGCCGDETLKCTATGKRSIGLEIMRVDPRGTAKMEVMQFTEHTACECRPRSASGVNSEKRKRNSEEGWPRAKFPFV